MMRYLFFLFLLLAGVARAETYSPTWLANAGVEKITFQQGLHPTAAYAGCEDTWIDSANATTNHGADSTLAFADTATEEMLIRFDISAIPDSAIVQRAYLHLYMGTEGTTQAGGDNYVIASRMFKAWVEAQATWNIYATASNWGTAGAADQGAIVTYKGYASTILNTRHSNNFSANWTTHDTYGGLDLSIGTDTLFSATDIDMADITANIFDPDVSAGVDAPRWIVLDVTEIVNGIHIGAWQNNGFKLRDYEGTAGEQTFKSSEAGWESTRPYLDVWYLYAVADAGSSGTGRRRGGFGL